MTTFPGDESKLLCHYSKNTARSECDCQLTSNIYFFLIFLEQQEAKVEKRLF
jgi:hypothetical protein